MEPPRVIRTPQHQNWALVNTSPELVKPCVKAQVRISFLQIKQVEQIQVAKGKPVKSDSRKRIDKLKAAHQKKLALHQMFLEGKEMK